MSRGYVLDEYDLERQHEIERRLEIGREQEPAWMHRPRRDRFLGSSRPQRQRRYFSALMFQPVRESASNEAAPAEKAA